AERALRCGRERTDRRMGFQGAQGELDARRFGQLRTLLEKRLADTGRRSQEGALLADLSRLAQPKPATAEEDEGAEERPETSAEGEAAPSSDEVLVRTVALVPVKEGLRRGG